MPAPNSSAPNWVYALSLVGDDSASDWLLRRFAADHASDSLQQLQITAMQLSAEIRSGRDPVVDSFSESGLRRRQQMLRIITNLMEAKRQQPRKVKIKPPSHPQKPKPDLQRPVERDAALDELQRRAAEKARQGLVEAIGKEPRVKAMWDALNGSKDAAIKLTRLLESARNDKSRFVTDLEFQKLLQEYFAKRHELEKLRQSLLDEYHVDVELVDEATGMGGKDGQDSGFSPVVTETISFVAQRAATLFMQKYGGRRPLLPKGVDDPGLKREEMNKDLSRVLGMERQAQLLGVGGSSQLGAVVEVALKADRTRIAIELEKLDNDIKKSGKSVTSPEVFSRAQGIVAQALSNARQAALLGVESRNDGLEKAREGDFKGMADSLRKNEPPPSGG